MMYEEIVSGLTAFIGKSPTAFHAIANIGDILKKHGYQRIYDHVGESEAGGSGGNSE